MTRLNSFHAWVLILALTGCAALTPKSFDQSLMLGYTSQTAALDATTLALRQGHIDKEEASNLLEISDSAGRALDNARALKDSDISRAKKVLSFAMSLIEQLEAYLKERVTP